MSEHKQDDHDYLFKVVLIGDSGVGKSAILNREKYNLYDPVHQTTIGVDFQIFKREIDDKKIKLQVWDTAGQERFRTITTSYYRGAHAILIVFDVTDPSSFDHVKSWLAEIDRFGGGPVMNKHAEPGVKGSTTLSSKSQTGYYQDTMLFLIGNKIDLDLERVVSSEEAKTFATKNGMTYLETSAKLGIDVSKAFDEIAVKIYQSQLQSMQQQYKDKTLVHLNGQSIEQDNQRCC